MDSNHRGDEFSEWGHCLIRCVVPGWERPSATARQLCCKSSVEARRHGFPLTRDLIPDRRLQETRGLEILTPARRNQRPARPAAVQRWLNHLRERIEGAFHEVQNTGRHPGT